MLSNDKRKPAYNVQLDFGTRFSRSPNRAFVPEKIRNIESFNFQSIPLPIQRQVSPAAYCLTAVDIESSNNQPVTALFLVPFGAEMHWRILK